MRNNIPLLAEGETQFAGPLELHIAFVLGEVLTIEGASLKVELLGEARYVEEFSAA